MRRKYLCLPARRTVPGGGACVVLPALLALLVFCPPSGAVPVPADLDLDKAPGYEVRSDPGPNPHDAFPCERCHVPADSAVSYAVAKKYGVTLPLITEGDSTSLLCEECHNEGLHAIHSTNLTVTEQSERIEKLGLFPLETIVEGYTKLTCNTCHNVHFPNTRFSLLRGFSLGKDAEEEGAFAARLDFCRACHGEEVRTISAHWEKERGEQCTLCHLGFRSPGVPGPVTKRINESCVVCHPIPRGERAHFYRYNPFPDFRRQELQEYGLPLERDQFTCNTCHSHHRPSDSETFLRPAFVSVISKSLRVNPHRTTRFCQNCHPFDPPPLGTPEAVAPLWEEDVTRLCRGCHSKEGALKMYHPLAMLGEGGKVPEGWQRRKDGSLGCQTCHLAGHGPYNRENPKMLRGGTEEERNAICFRCHDRSSYAGRNIHTEVAEFGGCEFCHIVKERTALRPEGKVGDLLAEPTLLCLLCHSPLPHPASANHTVKQQEHSFVQLDDEITPLTMGKLTCHTCHDSHSTKMEERFLRNTGASPLVCHNCHPF